MKVRCPGRSKITSNRSAAASCTVPGDVLSTVFGVDGGPVWCKRARTTLELQREAEALRLLGPTAVRLLRPESDVMVLERVLPGNVASELPDEASILAIAESLPRLWTGPEQLRPTNRGAGVRRAVRQGGRRPATLGPGPRRAQHPRGTAS